jgi:hypothetical protein
MGAVASTGGAMGGAVAGLDVWRGSGIVGVSAGALALIITGAAVVDSAGGDSVGGDSVGGDSVGGGRVGGGSVGGGSVGGGSTVTGGPGGLAAGGPLPFPLPLPFPFPFPFPLPLPFPFPLPLPFPLPFPTAAAPSGVPYWEGGISDWAGETGAGGAAATGRAAATRLRPSATVAVAIATTGCRSR